MERPEYSLAACEREADSAQRQDSDPVVVEGRNGENYQIKTVHTAAGVDGGRGLSSEI